MIDSYASGRQQGDTVGLLHQRDMDVDAVERRGQQDLVAGFDGGDLNNLVADIGHANVGKGGKGRGAAKGSGDCVGHGVDGLGEARKADVLEALAEVPVVEGQGGPDSGGVCAGDVVNGHGEELVAVVKRRVGAGWGHLGTKTLVLRAD